MFWHDLCHLQFSKTELISLNIVLFNNFFSNFHKPEANNCLSIITQVIIEIAEQRNAKSYLPLSYVSEQLRALTTWFKTTSVFCAFQNFPSLRKGQNWGYTLYALDGVNLR